MKRNSKPFLNISMTHANATFSVQAVETRDSRLEKYVFDLLQLHWTANQQANPKWNCNFPISAVSDNRLNVVLFCLCFFPPSVHKVLCTNKQNINHISTAAWRENYHTAGRSLCFWWINAVYFPIEIETFNLEPRNFLLLQSSQKEIERRNCWSCFHS